MKRRPSQKLQVLTMAIGALVGLITPAPLGLAFVALCATEFVPGSVGQRTRLGRSTVAAMLLGLISIRSKTIVAPVAGMTVAILTYPLFIAQLLPSARLVPLSGSLPPTPVVLACGIALFAMTTILVNAQVRLDSKLPLLKYVFAGGYALLLSASSRISRRKYSLMRSIPMQDYGPGWSD